MLSNFKRYLMNCDEFQVTPPAEQRVTDGSSSEERDMVHLQVDKLVTELQVTGVVLKNPRLKNFV